MQVFGPGSGESEESLDVWVERRHKADEIEKHELLFAGIRWCGQGLLHWSPFFFPSVRESFNKFQFSGFFLKSHFRVNYLLRVWSVKAFRER